MLFDFVNRLMIHMIGHTMMQNNKHLNGSLKRYLDEVIMQYTNWQPQGSNWILHLYHEWTASKVIQMSMITTATPGRLAVYFGYRLSPTGGASKRKRTQSMPISPMWLATALLLYPILFEWTQVLLLGEILFAGDSLKLLARSFRKRL